MCSLRDTTCPLVFLFLFSFSLLSTLLFSISILRSQLHSSRLSFLSPQVLSAPPTHSVYNTFDTPPRTHSRRTRLFQTTVSRPRSRSSPTRHNALQKHSSTPLPPLLLRRRSGRSAAARGMSFLPPCARACGVRALRTPEQSRDQTERVIPSSASGSGEQSEGAEQGPTAPPR